MSLSATMRVFLSMAPLGEKKLRMVAPITMMTASTTPTMLAVDCAFCGSSRTAVSRRISACSRRCTMNRHPDTCGFDTSRSRVEVSGSGSAL